MFSLMFNGWSGGIKLNFNRFVCTLSHINPVDVQHLALESSAPSISCLMVDEESIGQGHFLRSVL